MDKLLLAFRASYSMDYLLEFAASRHWKTYEQDVFNVLCEDRAVLIESNWNYIYGGESRFLPDALRTEYQESQAYPKIVHFAGPFKPWAVPNAPFWEHFWHYVTDTPYLELFLR